MSKNILITGCSSGIGHYSATHLHKAGYKVVATVRKSSDAASLETQGIRVILMDMSDQQSIEDGFHTAMDIFARRLDFLFNNAAYGQCGAVEDLSTDVLKAQFETNFFGLHTLTQLALKVMRTQNSGRIIQNSSILGFAAMPYRGAYNASKFALEGLTDTLRLELTNTPIKIILIEPGPIKSQFRANALAAFKANINGENSYHAEAYAHEVARLSARSSSSPFVLGPEAVYTKLLLAITASRPRARYYVTFPTHFIAFLQRFLPTYLLDKILIKAS